MNVLEAVLQGIEVIFYASVIIYIIRRWKD